MQAKVYNWCKTHPVLPVTVTLQKGTTPQSVYVRHDRRECPTCDLCHGWIDAAFLHPDGDPSREAPNLFPLDDFKAVPPVRTERRGVEGVPALRDAPLALDEASRFVMPWGKHKGKSLYDVPVEYLDWLMGQDWMRHTRDKGKLRQAIEMHLEHSRGQEMAELEQEE